MATTPTATCGNRYHNIPDCLGALAAGWITVMDLCGPCTARLILAVDWVTARDNTWHTGYTDRAAGSIRNHRSAP